MYRKLLVLSFVLLLPAMASAVSVSLLHNGASSLMIGPDMTIGQVITVELVSDTACTGIASIDFIDTGDFVINGLGSWNPAYFSDFPISSVGWLSGTDIMRARGLAKAGTIASAGVWLYRFQMTFNGLGAVCPQMGTADFFFDSAGAFTFGNNITQNALQIIPEPATIALLGLGGLLLRRRK